MSLALARRGTIASSYEPPAQNGIIWGAFMRVGDASTAADPPPLSLVQAREALLLRSFDYVHMFWGWNRAFSEAQNAVNTGVFGGGSGRKPIISWKPEGGGIINGIIAGTYNAYIDASAAWCAGYGGEIVIRFAWEMNGNWMSYSSTGSGGNNAAQYVTAWQTVVNRFNNAGATNVRWFWCPNETDYPVQAGNAMENYWPGPAYVDLIGFDAYNFGRDSVVRTFDAWKTFNTVMRDPYDRVAAINGSLDIWVGEFGCTEYSGYPNANNTPDPANTSIITKAAWIIDAFQQLPTYPRMKALIYFDQDSLTEAGVLRNWKFDSSGASTTGFRTALS